MNNEEIKKALGFLIEFYEKFDFKQNIAIVRLLPEENNYIALHDEVNNAMKVARFLKDNGYCLFNNILKHMELTHKETFVYSKYQENGERNKSPVLVNINYEQMNKDTFSGITNERIKSLNFMQAEFI